MPAPDPHDLAPLPVADGGPAAVKSRESAPGGGPDAPGRACHFHWLAIGLTLAALFHLGALLGGEL